MTLIQLVSLVSMAVIIIFCMVAYVRDHSRYENGIFSQSRLLSLVWISET